MSRLRRRLERLEAATGEQTRNGCGFAEDGGCEDLYLQELAWYEAGESELVHDPEAEAFYTSAGEFALSRDRVDVRAWINA